MYSQSILTSISEANQTAVPSLARKLLELKPGDKLLWDLNPSNKTVTLKPAPNKWGNYMKGLGKGLWKKDAQTYINEIRTDRQS